MDGWDSAYFFPGRTVMFVSGSTGFFRLPFRKPHLPQLQCGSALHHRDPTLHGLIPHGSTPTEVAFQCPFGQLTNLHDWHPESSSILKSPFFFWIKGQLSWFLGVFLKETFQIWDIYCYCCCYCCFWCCCCCCCVCICMCMCSVFVAVVFGSGKVQCTTMKSSVLLDNCQWHVNSLSFSSGYNF